MLTKREHLYILHYNQFIMIFVKYSTIDQIPHILLVAFREEQHSLRVSLWCTSEAFPFWILTNAF